MVSFDLTLKERIVLGCSINCVFSVAELLKAIEHKDDLSPQLVNIYLACITNNYKSYMIILTYNKEANYRLQLFETDHEENR